jgi:hypothetical protein
MPSTDTGHRVAQYLMSTGGAGALIYLPNFPVLVHGLDAGRKAADLDRSAQAGDGSAARVSAETRSS